MNDHNPCREAAVREPLIQSRARHHDFSPDPSGMPPRSSTHSGPWTRPFARSFTRHIVAAIERTV